MQRIVVYAPKYPIHPAMKLRQALLDLFDGLTEYSGVGSWRNSKGNAVGEGVFVFEIITDEHIPHDALADAIAKYQAEAEQEEVLCTIEHHIQIFDWRNYERTL